MKTAEIYDIVEENGRFIVTKNDQPIRLPKSDGQSIVTEFDSIEDAQKYVNILKSLTAKRNYK